MITYTGIGKIDGGDCVCILGGTRIHVKQPRYGSTARFRGMTNISYYPYCHYYRHIVIVIDYLTLGPGSAPGDWAVILGMYETLLKHGHCLQLISFNKFRISIDTCSRRSMGCVYYRWQLVFADIIVGSDALHSSFDDD